MSAFVCPQCGHSNEYDPWTENAECQQCGFAPPEGPEMLDYLQQQDTVAEQQKQTPPERPGATNRTRLTRFLPTGSRSFLAGLAWGAFVFAAIMLLSSVLELPGDFARCLGLLLPFLTTFAVWRWLAWRETGE